MNVFLRLKDKSNWSVTIRVELSFLGVGKGYWKVCAANDPWGFLCLRRGGRFVRDPKTASTDFQCQDAYGLWTTCFCVSDAPRTSADGKHTSGQGAVQQPANPAGHGLLIDWYRPEPSF